MSLPAATKSFAAAMATPADVEAVVVALTAWPAACSAIAACGEL